LAEEEAKRKGFAGAEAPVLGKVLGARGRSEQGAEGRRSPVMLFDEDTDEDTPI
jgi:hypothetical protein